MSTWARFFASSSHSLPRRGAFRPEFETLEERLTLDGTGFSTSALNGRLVGQLYEELLNRSADTYARPYWGGFLDKGVSKPQLVLGIEATAEFQRNAISDLYKDILKRAPDEAGLNYFAAHMATGKTIDDVKVFLLASPEYYKNRGGGTDSGFQAALRQDLLGSSSATATTTTTTTTSSASTSSSGSTGTSTGRTGADTGLGNVRDTTGTTSSTGGSTSSGRTGGTGSTGGGDAQTTTAATLQTPKSDTVELRTSQAKAMMQTKEAQEHLVDQLYRKHLNRAAEQGGLNYWVGLLNSGGKTEHLIAGITGSGEYSKRLEYDAVLDWNDQALNAVRTTLTPAPLAARDLAMVSLAMYDAVNAIDPLHSAYLGTGRPSELASAEAAAASAAHRVLTSLFPTMTTQLDSALQNSLGHIPSGASKDDGVAFGKSVADVVLAARKADGSSLPKTTTSSDTTSTTTTAPVVLRAGDYQAPPGSTVVEEPKWGNMSPFAITAATDFRPLGPIGLQTLGYILSHNEVKNFGSILSTSRTADQTTSAKFWNDGAGTATAVGHWNQIAADVSAEKGLTLADNARLFAQLNAAQADTAIAVHNTKSAYNYWRPITAVRLGDVDPSEFTTGDTTWTPLLNTPATPGYASDTSAYAYAASSILTSVFGADVHFSAQSDSLPGVTRSFTSFAAAAEEAGMSRIYAGVQFRFDHNDGQQQGQSVGDYVLKHFLT